MDHGDISDAPMTVDNLVALDNSQIKKSRSSY
jgi:hypothetical protein